MKDFSGPERLFKYFPPERVGVLSDLLVRHTPLGAFNDPFEGRPEITGLATRDEAIASFTKMLPVEAELAYRRLPLEVRAQMPLEKFVQLATVQMSQKQGDFLSSLDAAGRELLPAIPAKLDQLLGVFSLCEVPDSLLMWAHYGRSHTGFVLEIDPKHPFFNAQRTANDEFGYLRQVRYRDDRPSTSLSSLNGEDLFLVKSREWEYEKEWRILRPLKEADKVINAQGEDIHLFRLPADSIRAVILGARASDQLKAIASREVARGGFIAGSRLFSCRPDESTFSIGMVEHFA